MLNTGLAAGQRAGALHRCGSFQRERSGRAEGLDHTQPALAGLSSALCTCYTALQRGSSPLPGLLPHRYSGADQIFPFVREAIYLFIHCTPYMY